MHVGFEQLKGLFPRKVPVPNIMEEVPAWCRWVPLLHRLPLVSQVRELKDTQVPHTFLVSGKKRTLELQAR